MDPKHDEKTVVASFRANWCPKHPYHDRQKTDRPNTLHCCNSEQCLDALEFHYSAHYYPP